MLRLIDAPRCPYCARVRIALAEKGIAYETVVIDLVNRPAWVYELNPIGKVPVLEHQGWVLPESAVINEYLEDAYPEPALLPADPAQRANARLIIFRHDDFTATYYALRRKEAGADVAFAGELEALDAMLAGDPYLTGSAFGLADIAYVPWVLRARDVLGVSLESYPSLVDWLARLDGRPSIRAELEIIAAL
ncbi:glutathione S-transferase family protein [Gaiella sp.]